MSYVDITITGLALCNPIANGLSQFLILHPPGHNLAITLKTIGSSPGEVRIMPRPQYTMAVTTQGSTAPGPVTGGHDRTALVNLISKHRDFGGAGSTVAFKRKSTTRMKISYLSIPTNRIYTTTETTYKHELWVYKHHPDYENNPSSRTPTDRRRVKLWRDISFRFNIPAADAAAALNFNITSPVIEAYPLRHQSGNDYLITFDNDCHGHSCANDFGFYYEILVGKHGNYFVEIEEVPHREPVPENPDVNTEAACNPVIVDPAPDLGVWYATTGPRGTRSRPKRPAKKSPAKKTKK